MRIRFTKEVMKDARWAIGDRIIPDLNEDGVVTCRRSPNSIGWILSKICGKTGNKSSAACRLALSQEALPEVSKYEFPCDIDSYEEDGGVIVFSLKKKGCQDPK